MTPNLKYNRARMLLGAAHRDVDILRVPVVEHPLAIAARTGAQYSPTGGGFFAPTSSGVLEQGKEGETT